MPLNDAGHARKAIARFDQMRNVANAERHAAPKFDVEVSEKGWRGSGKPEDRAPGPASLT